MRRGRKFKERRSIFSFGHIMLPLVGLLALGLLILGVRLLFFQTPEEFSLSEYQVEDTVSPTQEPSHMTIEPEKKPEYTDAKPTQVVAVPVEISDEEGKTPTSISTGDKNTRPATGQAGRQETVGNQTDAGAAQKVAASPQTAPSSFWGVQVGAFTVRDSAEKVASELRQEGFEAFVIPAEVGGKQYYRVRVKAGDNRKAAEQLEKTLASRGYPTLVTFQD